MDKERFSLSVDGLGIVGETYSPPGPGPAPALCLCHGVPARPPDPSDRGYPLLAERFCAQGLVVTIFNFRGAGESEGDFDMLGWSRDLEAVIDYVYNLEGVESSRLSLMGFSGGAAVSVYLAARDQRITSLVACACPAHFGAVASTERVKEFIEQARQVGIIRSPGFPPSAEEWGRGFAEISPIRWVDRLSPRPILIVHGENDEVIDPGQAWQLYQKAGSPKDILIIKGGEHRLRESEAAMNVVLDWLMRVNGIATD